MSTRRYYHQRTRAQVPPRLELTELSASLLSSYRDLAERGYFQRALGYKCVDGNVPGTCGDDVAGWIQSNAWIKGVYPFCQQIPLLDEPTLFTTLELLWDLVSAPLNEGAHYHSYWDCGWHYEKFDAGRGREEWRGVVNNVLEFYGDGFELSEHGKVQPFGRATPTELITAGAIHSSIDHGNRGRGDGDTTGKRRGNKPAIVVHARPEEDPADALVEEQAVERVPVASPHALRGERTASESLPAGMSAWVSADDVERAMGCSRSKAHEYLRRPHVSHVFSPFSRGVATRFSGKLPRLPRARLPSACEWPLPPASASSRRGERTSP